VGLAKFTRITEIDIHTLFERISIMKNITSFGLWLMADVQRVRFLLLALTALALILMVVVGTASHSLLIAGPATGGSGGTG
jgi:hypothetical protein